MDCVKIGKLIARLRKEHKLTQYEIGPASIAWIMWHMIYWWSSVLDINFGEGTLRKGAVSWPGSVEEAKAAIASLHDQWVVRLKDLSDADMQSKHYAKWPLEDRSFTDIALWLNGELMKNAAEIGYGRFLYAAAPRDKA